jgi:hypothetical protein
MVQRGEPYWIGDFDKDGNFIRYPQFSANYAGIITVRFVHVVDCTDFEVLGYEHRSCRILQGTMVKIPPPADPEKKEKRLVNSRHVFVPEIGSTILDIKDINLKKLDRPVWNIPETIPVFFEEWRRKNPDKMIVPKAPEPPKAGIPAGWEFTPFSQSHPKKSPKHARVLGEVVEYGHLSDEGEFIPDPDLPVFSRSGILGEMSSETWAVPRYYTLPRRDKDQKVQSVPAYEYRSGRLIRGDLHESGNFVPELGSKVIDFKDYDPEKEPRRRIYNLPGELKKAE